MEKKSRNNSKSIEYACKVCARLFANLQECLKHELLEHSLSKKPSKKSQRNHLKIMLNTLKQDDNKDLQLTVEASLKSCKPGEELKTVLKHFCVDTESLEQAYNDIYTCLNRELGKIGRFTIYPFGSIANGLALQSSDIDIYIESEKVLDYSNKNIRIMFNRVNSYLFRSICFGDIVPIRKARVPIIKCTHLPSGYKIDINMSCPSSVNNTTFLRDIMQFDTRLHQLFLFMKIWFKNIQIIGRSGNMTSYCLMTLVIFYLQNTVNLNVRPILPSMQRLQENVTAKIIQGVNYAYNLRQVAPLAEHHTVRGLIEGFFAFYHKFDFMPSIVSPFLGQTIARNHLEANDFEFKEYKDQLRALSILEGVPAMTLPLQHCMCVQDIFCLNLNVARSVTPPGFEYFCHCLSCAAQICITSSLDRTSDADFYKTLLYGMIGKLSQVYLDQKNSEVQTPVSTPSLSFTHTPSRADMRTLVMYMKNLDTGKSSLNKRWVQYNMEIIEEMLVDIYMLDVQKAHPTVCIKAQKLEDSELTHTWVLNGSVDMWTGRTFEGKNSLSFMERQKQLTKKYRKERRQDAFYAVQMNALLTLNIRNDYTAIELNIQQTDCQSTDVAKKNPLRRFFSNFKFAIQSFNLKEKLITESEKLLDGLTNGSFKTKADEFKTAKRTVTSRSPGIKK